MNKLYANSLGLIVVLSAAGVALAQPDPGGEQTYKIGPFLQGVRLRASDVVTIQPGPFVFPGQAGSPVNPPNVGWAGYRFTVHVLDNTELDVDSVTPYPIVANPSGGGYIQIPGDPDSNPLGGRSNNVVSVPWESKVIHPLHEESGIDIFGGDEYQIADLQIHIKGTNNPAQNSDTDLEIKVWNIWHYRDCINCASQIVQLDPSALIWVGSNIDSFDQLLHDANSTFSVPPSFPIPPMSSPEGHWLHIPTFVPFHFVASQYFATLANTFTVGIDHIPEPASVILFGLGAACAVMGARSRRRRS